MLHRLYEDEGGAIAVMAAVLVVTALVAGALAVDVGRAASVSRDQQGATDRAALDSVRVLNEHRPEGLLVQGNKLSDAVEEVRTAAVESFERPENHPSGSGAGERTLYRVDLGRTTGSYHHEFEMVCGRVFDEAKSGEEPLPPTCGSDSLDDHGVTALRLWTHDRVPYVLALGHETGESEIRKVAVAASAVLGSISAGSRTASLEGGVLNRLLSSLLGADVALDAVGYEGLASAVVDLELLATELGLGSIDELAEWTLNVGGSESDDGPPSLLGAMVKVLEAEGEALDVTVDTLRTLQVGASELDPIQLGEILAIETGSGTGADVGVDALGLALASLMLANADPDLQGGECDSSGALVLDLDIPNLAETCLRIIQPPVIAVGPARRGQDDAWTTVARTAQVELDVALELDSISLDLGGLLGTRALDDELRLTVDAGRASVALTDADCVEPGWMKTEAETGAATVTVHDTTVLDVGITIPLVGGVGAHIGLGGDLPVAKGQGAPEFQGPFPSDSQTVGAEGLGLGGLIGANLGDLTEINLLGLSLGESGVLSRLTTGLEPVLTTLDGPLDGLLQTLGVQLGEVDVRALDLDCDNRRLLPLEAKSDA